MVNYDMKFFRKASEAVGGTTQLLDLLSKYNNIPPLYHVPEEGDDIITVTMLHFYYFFCNKGFSVMDNKEFMIRLIQGRKNMVKYADDRLMNDKDVIIAALRSDVLNARYIGRELLEDKQAMGEIYEIFKDHKHFFLIRDRF